jgi:flagellar hook assembly protein FlgD
MRSEIKNSLIHTTLKVYNVLGQLVETLVDKRQKPGTYRVTWDASKVASGVYFYRLEVKGDRLKVTETRKMVVIK